MSSRTSSPRSLLVVIACPSADDSRGYARPCHAAHHSTATRYFSTAWDQPADTTGKHRQAENRTAFVPDPESLAARSYAIRRRRDYGSGVALSNNRSMKPSVSPSYFGAQTDRRSLSSTGLPATGAGRLCAGGANAEGRCRTQPTGTRVRHGRNRDLPSTVA